MVIASIVSWLAPTSSSRFLLDLRRLLSSLVPVRSDFFSSLWSILCHQKSRLMPLLWSLRHRKYDIGPKKLCRFNLFAIDDFPLILPTRIRKRLDVRV